MRVRLLWPFGQHRPGEVIDCDPTLGKVLIREEFAASATGVPADKPKNPTIAELRQLAADEGITLDAARRRFVDDIASQRQGAPTCE